MSTLADRFFKSAGVASESVEVAGVTFDVRSMSLDDRNRLVSELSDDEGTLDNSKFYKGVVVATCFDPETGEAAFTEADLDRLGSARASVVDELAAVGLKLSGLEEKAVDEAGKAS